MPKTPQERTELTKTFEDLQSGKIEGKENFFLRVLRALGKLGDRTIVDNEGHMGGTGPKRPEPGADGQAKDR